MSKISLKHSGGNVVSLNVPSSAPTSADVAFKLPNADGSAGQYIKTDGSGNLSFATVVDTKGVEIADQWRINAGGTLTTDGITQFTANWERGDTNSHGQIGSGMSESSGIFTFPSTGIYQITATFTFQRDSSENRYAQLRMMVTTDNSNYSIAALGHSIFPTLSAHQTTYTAFLFDVTDTSTHKVRFEAYTNRSDVKWKGNSGYNDNSVTFIKLGDT